MVKTSGICKSFMDPKRGTIKAVDNVSMVARPGEIVGLLGTNGAGKTTLLRLLSTVLSPTEGTAEVAGFDTVRQPDQVRRSIGFMSNSTALYGRLTPVEMLNYFGKLNDIFGDKLKIRVAELIQMLNISDYQNSLCDKLSTGQKQRVNIARTLLSDPPVLFFDEPTAGLDVVMSQDVMLFIEQQRIAGKTVIYCTHIMSEVERLCDRTYVISEGKIVAEGTVSDLKNLTGTETLEQAFLSLVKYESDLHKTRAGALA